MSKRKKTEEAINQFFTQKTGKKEKNLEQKSVIKQKKKTEKSVKKSKKLAKKNLNKVGRPNTLQPNKTYVRLGGAITEDTMFRLKGALAGIFRGQHRTQQELIEKAINFYIDAHEKTGK